MKRLVWILLFVLAGFRSWAGSPPECLFETYSTLNGMPHDRVSDIYTDSRGFVWICTWYGVSRFDGYSFRNYSTSPADYSPLSHHRFLSVSEDANGHLWFITYNYHLYRLNRYTEQFEDVAALIAGVDPKHCRMGECLHDKVGGTWVSVADLGVVRFVDRPDGSPVEVDAVFDAPVLGGDVAAMFVDDRNHAWIAASDGQINYVSAQESPRRARIVASSSAAVFSIVEGRENVYCATPHSLIRIDKSGRHPVEARAGGAVLTALTTDTVRRTVYAGSRDGRLFRMGAFDTTLVPLTPGGTHPARIRYLAADSRGILWIAGTEAGITRYDPDTDDCKHFEQRPYTVSYNVDTLPKIAEGGGRLWIKMNRYGFGYYDRDRDEVEPFYNDPSRPECRMTNGVVRFDVQDDGVLWLSTYNERGLCRAVILNQPAQTRMLASRFPGPFAGVARAMCRDRRGHTWIGTRDGELFCFDAARRQLCRFPEDGAEGLGMIYALKEDSAGDIWIGTKGNGLYRLSTRSGRPEFRHYLHAENDPWSLNDDQIYSIEEDHLHRIWLATYGGGVNLLADPEQGRFIHAGNLLSYYPIGVADRVRYLLFDAPDRMLAATVDGLLLFDPGADPGHMRFSVVQKIPGDPSSLGNNDIIQMLKDSHGRVWLATYGGGLNRIEGYRDGLPYFRCYDRTRGLPGNICMALTEDRKGELWIATHSAVSRFDTEKEIFTNYMLYDNMHPANFSEATCVTAASGHVLFGADGNIYEFDPDRMRAAKIDYRLCFTGLDVGNRPVAPGPDSPLSVAITEADRIVLPHDYTSFRISFASLNFTIRNGVGYMYKLEGHDRDWIIAGGVNSATYSNVPVGRYRLHVKAFTGNIDAADEGVSIPVTILSPMWLTWWAKLCYVLLVAAVATLIFKAVSSVIRIRREASVEQDMTDMKLRFFTNVSHELRTPLTLIIGGIEDVRKHDTLSPRGDISLTLAHKNAKRMLTLINQLLDFRKIVKNKMELKIAHVDLVPLIEDALDDFRELASERDIELLFTVSRRSVLVWVDVERMESVVYNLLSNALKFTRNGGRIEVILSCREQEECVTLTVKDNGIGIPRDRLGSIFDRFSQASRSVDPSMKGSGIGLSLCRDIVALHHGEISVDSRQGEGSAFTVKLRLGNAHFGMEQIDFSGERPAGGKSNYMVSDYTSERQRRTDVEPPAGAQKILLVEDNRDLRLFLYNNLIENYQVVEADDGVEAMEKIRSEMPDIIITDLMMPNMDGTELIRKVREDFSISHLPIIMLTAKHSPDNRVKAMEYGADGYITKPFSIELLLARIDNLLTQRRNLFERFSTQTARNKIAELVLDGVVVTDKDEVFMKEVMSWLGNNIENSSLTIDQLASHLGLGRTTMYNKLKSLTGKSPVELIKEFRITRSKLLLRTGQYSVSEVAYKVGFSDPGYFSRCFREQFGMSPAEYLRSHNLKQTQEPK